MTYTTRYTVRGTGDFPIDMLRYDHSFPWAEEDTAWILRKDEREVMLGIVSAAKNPHIERNRWQSFGWIVTERYPSVAAR